MDQAASTHQAFLRHFAHRRKTQIWIAMATYALVAIVKKRLGLPHSLYTIFKILSTAIFDKPPSSLCLNAMTTKSRIKPALTN
jgi:hypothetical protein